MDYELSLGILKRPSIFTAINSVKVGFTKMKIARVICCLSETSYFYFCSQLDSRPQTPPETLLGTKNSHLPLRPASEASTVRMAETELGPLLTTMSWAAAPGLGSPSGKQQLLLTPLDVRLHKTA